MRAEWFWRWIDVPGLQWLRNLALRDPLRRAMAPYLKYLAAQDGAATMPTEPENAARLYELALLLGDGDGNAFIRLWDRHSRARDEETTHMAGGPHTAESLRRKVAATAEAARQLLLARSAHRTRARSQLHSSAES